MPRPAHTDEEDGLPAQSHMDRGRKEGVARCVLGAVTIADGAKTAKNRLLLALGLVENDGISYLRLQWRQNVWMCSLSSLSRVPRSSKCLLP